MKKIIPALLLATTAQAFAQADASFKNVQFNGWGFMRHETKDNADFKSGDANKDKTDFTSTRVNFSFKADLAENYGYVFIAPQFSKVAGLRDSVPNQTSGGLTDSTVDMHEAYFAFKPTLDENLYLFVGRQELAYGDHLVIGSVPWHRIGRSFDGVKASYKVDDKTTVDAFATKLIEQNSAAYSATEDSDFYGVYATSSFGENFKAVDAYLLNRVNQATGDFSDTTAYGLRFKSTVGETAFDYRAEGTMESVVLAGTNSTKGGEYQYDVELGYTLPFYTTRVAFEYFDSTKNYDQLFPTAHKWVGYADQFARRNLKGYVAHVSTRPMDKVTFFADYHVFSKHSKNDAAYAFSGAAYASASDKTAVANELDLTIAYDFTKTLQLSGGYSMVSPEKYLKDNDQKGQTQWSYLQLLARF